MNNLIVFCGPPCSGKTSYLSHYPDYSIVKSDDEIKKYDGKNLSQNELNIFGITDSLKKIENLRNDENNIVYDSTNLTVLRRKEIFLIQNISFTAVNFLTDFNIIYDNWEKRGKDIAIESLFYLKCIFQKSKKTEGFQKIITIEQHKKSDYKELIGFLKTGVLHLDTILEENKDLKFLYYFWKKGKKDFFAEYFNKLNYLDDLILEDKLALLYSEIKYFYDDFINFLDITYTVSSDDFIDGFFENILKNKIKDIGLNKQKCHISFIKLGKLF